MNNLLLGDCLVLMKDIPDNSIDMILCDLPYGTTACKWDNVIPFELLWEQYKRIRKETTPIVLFGYEPFSSYLRMSNITEYKYDWIWEKNKAINFLNCKKQPIRKTELISVFYKKQCLYNPQLSKKDEKNIRSSTTTKRPQSELYGKMNKLSTRTIPINKSYPNEILKFRSCSCTESLHPTQKIVALCVYLIKTYTKEGDIVLDNCAGSGTTGIACLSTKRKYILMEKDKKYFNIMKKRIKRYKEILNNE
jgi:site-specific DNA-methyltransferase (adenine-specific)